MTIEEARSAAQARRTLLSRLDAGDALHQEAAAEIRRLHAEAAEVEREAREDRRASYISGCEDTQERYDSDRW